MDRNDNPQITLPDASGRPLDVLICSTPVEGHVNPATSIARSLVERGHRVRWYTGTSFRSTVEATGATFEPPVVATDPMGSLDERFPGRTGLDGMAGLKFDLEHVFIGEAPGQVRDLQRILDDFPADVLVADTAFVAAALIHELGGPPFATYGISVLPIPSRDLPPLGSGRLPSTSPITRRLDRIVTPIAMRVLFRDVQHRFQQARRTVGLPADRSTVFDTFVSPLLYLHGSTESFEYPRSDLPDHVHFVGPLVPAAASGQSLPGWWDTIDHDKPLILVNQGTVAVDLGDLVGPTLATLGDDDVVVIATGGSGRRGIAGPIPANAHVEAYIPFGSILPHVDVMITNGGFGGVQLALAHGVPMVVAGTTEDKPEIAARVEWSGTGINLRTRRPTQRQLSDAVWSVLTDERYRHAADGIAMEAARLDAPRIASDLIEELAVTGRPVPRERVRGLGERIST